MYPCQYVSNPCIHYIPNQYLLEFCSINLLIKSPTTDTQWRQKSKISEKLGRCGRQNMLPPYLKIWEWEWIFGRAVKAISSLGVRSPWFCQFQKVKQFNRDYCLNQNSNLSQVRESQKFFFVFNLVLQKNQRFFFVGFIIGDKNIYCEIPRLLVSQIYRKIRPQPCMSASIWPRPHPTKCYEDL